jgi:hypothetical protein
MGNKRREVGGVTSLESIEIQLKGRAKKENEDEIHGEAPFCLVRIERPDHGTGHAVSLQADTSNSY